MRIQLKDTATLTSQLSEFLAAYPDLTTIDFTDNQLGVGEKEDLCGMFAIMKDTSIESLDLSGTGLFYKSAEELKDIVNSLKETNVTSVILQDNFLGDHMTVRNLKDFLSGFSGTKVKDIDLRHNHLDKLDHEELEAALTAIGGISIEYEKGHSVGLGS